MNYKRYMKRLHRMGDGQGVYIPAEVIHDLQFRPKNQEVYMQELTVRGKKGLFIWKEPEEM